MTEQVGSTAWAVGRHPLYKRERCIGTLQYYKALTIRFWHRLDSAHSSSLLPALMDTLHLAAILHLRLAATHISSHTNRQVASYHGRRVGKKMEEEEGG